MAHRASSVILALVVSLFARTAEVGSRTLVHAAEGVVEIHGSYLNDCKPGQYVRYLIAPMTQLTDF